MVMASSVDEEGLEIHPRKWNREFLDMPVAEKAEQNTLCFSREIMSGLAPWKFKRERMLFILFGAAGLRVGEALGLEIEKTISSDFLMISIKQKAHHGRVEEWLKTARWGQERAGEGRNTVILRWLRLFGQFLLFA